jgi:hypothetical protein
MAAMAIDSIGTPAAPSEIQMPRSTPSAASRT